MNSPILLVLKDIRCRLGRRALLAVAMMILNAFTAGLGATLLFPLLSSLGLGHSSTAGGANRIAAAVLALIGPRRELTMLIAIIVVAFLLQSAVTLGEGWLTSRLRSAYTKSWRVDLFRAFFDARWHFFTRRKTGQLMNTLLQETVRLSAAFYLVGLAGAGLVFIAVYLVIAFIAAWQVALGIAVFGVTMSLAVRPLIRRAQRMGKEVTQRNEAMHIMVAEFLGGAKLIKATATEGQAVSKFGDLVSRTAILERLTTFHPSMIRVIFEVAAVLVLGACLWLGIVVAGIDPAVIIVVVFLFVRIYQRLSEVQQCLQNLHATYAPAIVPLLQALDEARADAEPIVTDDASATLPFQSAVGAAIQVCEATVRYDGRAALSEVTLDFPAGSVVGIAGPSGAGKSTLIDCILGLVPLDGGVIEIGGRSLTQMPVKAWRRVVGYVAQDTFLFNASIAENIRWGNPEATDADIEVAARQAHAEEFIRVLPQGYQTEVGDRGVRLSGGQRQRVGLARALVGSVRLLILDEATSSLDSESERAVLEVIEELRGQMTVIMVAHRLSTLRGADRLYLLEDGRVVETGGWDELIRSGTRFGAFWKLQSDERPALTPTI